MDKGKGGKYLILPPGYKEKTPDGYIAMPSDTYAGYALLRSNVKSSSEAEIAKAVAYGKRVKFYPLSQAANPAGDEVRRRHRCRVRRTIPYDLRFFRVAQPLYPERAVAEADKAMIDQLKSIGIEKGKPFNPDAKTQQTLKEAAREAHAWLDNEYEASFSPPFNEGTHWALPARRT